MNLDKISRTLTAAYAVGAVLNVISFIYWGHDMTKIAIAFLFATLITAQHAIDSWRHTANEWRKTAEIWRDLAERRRL